MIIKSARLKRNPTTIDVYYLFRERLDYLLYHSNKSAQEKRHSHRNDNKIQWDLHFSLVDFAQNSHQWPYQQRYPVEQFNGSECHRYLAYAIWILNQKFQQNIDEKWNTEKRQQKTHNNGLSCLKIIILSNYHIMIKTIIWLYQHIRTWYQQFSVARIDCSCIFKSWKWIDCIGNCKITFNQTHIRF